MKDTHLKMTEYIFMNIKIRLLYENAFKWKCNASDGNEIDYYEVHKELTTSSGT